MNVASVLIALWVVDLMAVASPGPAFLLTSQTALRSGTRAGIGNVAGLVAATVVWCAAALAGLSALFAIAPWLNTALRVFGGVYLIHLGIASWRSEPTNATIDPAPPASLWRATVAGFLIGVSNPKVVIYFASIFTLFVNRETPPAMRAGAVAIVLFDPAAWFALVVFLFSRPAFQSKYLRVQRALDRVAGSLLAAFGLRLMVSAKD
jgi:threonine efflux protein